jgi:hypothetical protein
MLALIFDRRISSELGWSNDRASQEQRLSEARNVPDEPEFTPCDVCKMPAESDVCDNCLIKQDLLRRQS